MRARGLILGMLAAAVCATEAHAQAFIPVSTSAGLTAAIASVSDGGVIELASGTYASPPGGFVITNQARRFTIRAAPAATPVLSGGGVREVLHFQNASLPSGRPVVFQGLTFDNGLSTTSGIAGGVTMSLAEATFTNCTFSNNKGNPAAVAGGGAALISNGSVAFFLNATFSGNQARNFGGGLAVEDAGTRVVIHNSTFLNNRTNLPGHFTFAAGGAIHVGNSVAGTVFLRVTNTRFDSNQAGYVGGAIYAIGSWVNAVTTPAADVRVANCTFINNRAEKDPGVPNNAPTEGGAFHAEDLTFAQIYNSRFVTNRADNGGGVNLYRAIVEVRKSVFQGNQAVGTVNSQQGFGGALSVISSDANDASTNFGAINRPSATLTVSDTLFQGRFGGVTTTAQNAGCLYATGDTNRLYGLNGVAQNGTAATNRATLSITDSVFNDCDVAETGPDTGRGGAMYVDLVAMTLTNSIVMNSDGFAGGAGQYSAGGGLALTDASDITIAGTTIANNSAGCYGGGILVQGVNLNMSSSNVIRNSVTGSTCGAGFGSAIFAGPFISPAINLTGTVSSSVIAENTGGSGAIYDDDRPAPLPFNDLHYNSNTIRGPSVGSNDYQDALTGPTNVTGLNALTVTRPGGTNTKKALSNNTNPAGIPPSGQIVAVPPARLATGAPTDALPTPSYIGYAWGGAATATVNGVSKSSPAVDVVTTVGTQTLAVVGMPSVTDTVANAAAPSATLTATPPSIALGSSSTLSWTTPSGTFIEADLDQSAGAFPATPGSTMVMPTATGNIPYNYLAVTQEGGALATATLSVNPGPTDLSISKTDGKASVNAGDLVTYTIVVTNFGPNAVGGAAVVDNFPGTLTGVTWTCAALGGSACGAPSGAGNINTTADLLFPGTATYTATGTLNLAATGTLSNTATVATPGGVTDPTPGNNSATDMDNIIPAADLSITKTDNRLTANPGQAISYTIVATNNGPTAVVGATVTDTVPAELTGATWTCVAAGGGNCNGASGGPNINASVNLPVNATVTYTLSGTVSANPATLINTATIAPPGAVNDPNPSNNSATDSDLLICHLEPVVIPDGRLTAATIGAGANAFFGTSLRIGDSYSVEFKNATGTNVAPGVLTVFRGDDGCGASTLTPPSTTGVEPGESTGAVRVSFTATGVAPFFQLTLDNTAGPTIAYSFSVSDTTMFSPAWTTNGSFNTFYSFLNTTGTALNGTLTLFDTAGATLSVFPLSIPAGQTASTNTSALMVARSKTGTARFTHDGPPGSIVAEAAIGNFTISPAYVQPVKFQATREAK